MSIYETVKAEFGPAPAYPRKPDFTTVYGYAKGQTLGSFPDAAAATKAGAVTTEKVVDDAGFEAASVAYRDFNSRVIAEWQSRMKFDLGLTDEVFNVIYAEAYDRGHSAGYSEVELEVNNLADFAAKIIAASKKA